MRLWEVYNPRVVGCLGLLRFGFHYGDLGWGSCLIGVDVMLVIDAVILWTL